jgi:uncharacterized protein YjlB
MSEPEEHLFADGGEIPNNPRLFLLIYKETSSLIRAPNLYSVWMLW